MHCFEAGYVRTQSISRLYIRDVPGGNINILGSHSIGHSKQKKVCVHVSNSERYSSKTVDKSEITNIPVVSNTGIYCSSDKVSTVYLG
jgi:hypothetical protein